MFLCLYALSVFFYIVCTKQLDVVEEISGLTILILKVLLVFYVSLFSIRGTIYVGKSLIVKSKEYIETKNRIKELVFKGLAFESMQKHISEIETILQLEEQINKSLKEQQDRFFEEHMYQKKEPDANI